MNWEIACRPHFDYNLMHERNIIMKESLSSHGGRTLKIKRSTIETQSCRPDYKMELSKIPLTKQKEKTMEGYTYVSSHCTLVLVLKRVHYS